MFVIDTRGPDLKAGNRRRLVRQAEQEKYVRHEHHHVAPGRPAVIVIRLVMIVMMGMPGRFANGVGTLMMMVLVFMIVSADFSGRVLMPAGGTMLMERQRGHNLQKWRFILDVMFVLVMMFMLMGMMMFVGMGVSVRLGEARIARLEPQD